MSARVENSSSILVDISQDKSEASDYQGMSTAHAMTQSIENNNECELGEQFDNLLEILSVMEHAVTELFYDVVKSWTCLDPNVARQLIERFSYLAEKVIKISPQWYALCDANEPIAYTTQQMHIDKAREAIKIIEGGLGWIYSIVYDNSPTSVH